MKDLVLFYPEGHQDHQLFGHPERPERVEAIRKGMVDSGIWHDVPQIFPHQVDPNVLRAVHTPEYLSIVEAASKMGSMLDPDTYTTAQSWQLALNAAGGAAAVAEAVWDREYQAGFALSRPPGHHATASRGMGFCLINNIAVAAEYLINKKEAQKIAILDLDVHHGNGTQDIFYDRKEVCFCSIHQAPFYPGTGTLGETGSGRGQERTMNLPIPSGSGDECYQVLLRELILPFLEKEEPEMLLVSYGFDTHWRDPLGSIQLSAETIFGIFQSLQSWANTCCEGRLAVILEGGYDLEAGSACGGAIGAALTGRSWEDPLGRSPIAEQNHWLETLDAAQKIWDF